MKNLLYLFLIGILFSCGGAGEDELNPEEPDVNGEPKEYIVSLGMTGEIEVSESPLLGRASSDDLYRIQVYSKSKTSEYIPYANGLFDDKSNIQIKLLEGYEYKFVATMIVDAKNRMFSSNVDGNIEYLTPFNSILSNYFSYDSENSKFFSLGAAFEINANQSYYIPRLDRYYGEISGYTPTQDGNVSINMKRVVFGVKFIAEGLNEGMLRINIKEARELSIVYGETSGIEGIFTFRGGIDTGLAWTADDYSETIPVTVSWEKEDGAIIPLVSQDITFKRKTLTTITIKVKDSSVNNGVEISQEGGDLIAGDNITIESGTGVENPVEPNI